MSSQCRAGPSISEQFKAIRLAARDTPRPANSPNTPHGGSSVQRGETSADFSMQHARMRLCRVAPKAVVLQAKPPARCHSAQNCARSPAARDGHGRSRSPDHGPARAACPRGGGGYEIPNWHKDRGSHEVRQSHKKPDARPRILMRPHNGRTSGLALDSCQRPKPSRYARPSCADNSLSPSNFPHGDAFNIAQSLFDLASRGSSRSVRTGEKLAQGGFVRTDHRQADERTSLLRV